MTTVTYVDKTASARYVDTRVKCIQTLSAPTTAQFCVLYILLLICSYMFWHNCQPQGADINVVKTYSNNALLYVLTTLA
jgi:hypothetical protein